MVLAPSDLSQKCVNLSHYDVTNKNPHSKLSNKKKSKQEDSPHF